MDNKGKNDIDRLFGDRLQDAQVAPPAGLWEGIAADLENDRLRKKVVYWRYVAAAIALIFLTVGGLTALQFGMSGRSGVAIVSNEVISLPYSDSNLVDASSQGNLAAVTSPQMDQNPTAATAATDKAALRLENVVDLPLPGNSTRVVRNELKRVHKKQLRGGQKTRKGPFILAALAPTNVQLNPAQPPLGLRSEFAKIIFTEPAPGTLDQGALAHEDISPDPAVRVKKLPRRLRKEREILFAEDDDRQARRAARKWAIGGSFSPDVAFAGSTPVDNGSLGAALKVRLPADPALATRKQSAPVATFTTGMRASVDLNERVALQSGIQYTRRTTTAIHESHETGLESEFDNNFRMGYLEIPLAVKYKLLAKDKLDWFVSSGVSGNLFVNYQQELQTEEGSIAARRLSKQADVLNPSQANFLVSTGVQYRIKDQISLNLEPGFRYGFLTSKYAFTQSDPISLSLATGLNFHF